MFFESFERALIHCSCILKKNEKFSILKLNAETEKNYLVLKVELNGLGALEKEAKRLIELKNSSTFYEKKIPEIVYCGRFESGILKGHFFYLMEFIDGETVSQLLDKSKVKIDICSEFLFVFKTLAQEIKTTDILAPNLKLSDLLADIKVNYEAIKSSILFSSIYNSESLHINNQTYANPLINFDQFCTKIENIMKIDQLKDGHKLHNNYHGGNVILSREKDHFYTIDPDVSVKVCDTTFGLARLIYTPLHEQCEKNTYTFEFTVNQGVKISSTVVDVNPELSSIWHDEIVCVINTIKSLSDASFKRRLWLSLIQCLIRGITANYSTKLEFNKNLLISHPSAYLFFCLVVCWDLIGEVEKI